MSHNRQLLAIVTIAILLGAVPRAEAQTGGIVGTVVDTTKAAIPGANVTITGGPGVVRNLQTDGKGLFEARLHAGAYQVRIELRGFQSQIRSISLAVGDEQMSVFVLEVGTADGSAFVSGAMVAGAAIPSSAQTESPYPDFGVGVVFGAGWTFAPDVGSTVSSVPADLSSPWRKLLLLTS